jgi:hypothetical protein
MMTVWSLHDAFHLECPTEKARANLPDEDANALECGDSPDVSKGSA